MREQRTFLPALVPPWAAYIIDRDLGRQLEEKAATWRAAGQDVIAEALLVAVAQLRESGRQRWEAHLQERRSEVTHQAAVGTSEVPISPGSAESVSPIRGGHGPGLSTGQVAEMLEIGVRQVVNLIHKPDGGLSATWHRGRWVIDEVSLAELIESRRSR